MINDITLHVYDFKDLTKSEAYVLTEFKRIFAVNYGFPSKMIRQISNSDIQLAHVNFFALRNIAEEMKTKTKRKKNEESGIF